MFRPVADVACDHERSSRGAGLPRRRSRAGGLRIDFRVGARLFMGALCVWVLCWYRTMTYFHLGDPTLRAVSSSIVVLPPGPSLTPTPGRPVACCTTVSVPGGRGGEAHP